MTGYKKLSDSWALDATEQGEGEQTLATLATLAGVPGQNAFLAGVQGENSNADFHGTKNAKSTGGRLKRLKLLKFSPPGGIGGRSPTFSCRPRPTCGKSVGNNASRTVAGS